MEQQSSKEAQRNRRARQADQTRVEILEAALALFTEKGYAKTTIAEIAGRAGVSAQTIYDSIGSKAAIVGDLNDTIDARAGIAAIAAGLGAATDPEELLTIAIRITRALIERAGDIVRAVYSGAAVDDGLRVVRDEGGRRHKEGAQRIAGRMAQLGKLSIGVDEAADVIGALTEASFFLSLIDDYNWSLDQIEDWLNATLLTLVLNE